MPDSSPRRRFQCLAVVVLWAAWTHVGMATETDSPVGLWRSLDDRTGRPQALIRITERDGRFFGRVEWTDDPKDQTKRCEPCTGDRHGAPIIGLEIIRDVERVDDGFDRGTILDPRNGAVVDCRLRLEEGGGVLVVRGYLGLPLLGGSRRWYRVS